MVSALIAAALAAFQPAPCAFEGMPAGFEQKENVQCGWISVPLRQDAPGGKTIRLWTARIRTLGPARADPVVYINGGPGVATVNSILPGLHESKTLAMLRQKRDIILFDQRGSGKSEESLCPALAKKLNALEQLGLDPIVEEERNRAAFADCRAEVQRAGSDLDAYTTSATVSDLDAIRRAFGVDQWNLLSISYGSLVALHAMRTHPRSVRAAILNSPFPPNSVAWAEQASGMAAAYSAIDRVCGAQPTCRARFGDLVPKLEATLSRLERRPLRDGETVITGRRFAEALWPIAVRSSTVHFVPLAIDRAYRGDATVIRKMVAKYAGGDSFGDYSPAQAMAINCHETGRTTRWHTRARALYPALVSPSPDDSWDRLCATFRPGFAEASFFAPVSSTIPTLIYAGTLDPATPAVDAYQAMRFLDRATLIEVEGASHGPMGIDDCTRGIAEAFLDNPTAEPDLNCIAKRKPIAFATKGFDQLLKPDNP